MIEDPFQGTLRLSILCDTIRRDVLGDEHNRSTAFRLEEKDKVKRQSSESDPTDEQNDAADISYGLDTSFE